jgi:hypothetical protein
VHIADGSEIEVHPWRSGYKYNRVDAHSRVVWSSNACLEPLHLYTPRKFSDLNGSGLTVLVSQDANG